MNQQIRFNRKLSTTMIKTAELDSMHHFTEDSLQRVTSPVKLQPVEFFTSEQCWAYIFLLFMEFSSGLAFSLLLPSYKWHGTTQLTSTISKHISVTINLSLVAKITLYITGGNIALALPEETAVQSNKLLAFKLTQTKFLKIPNLLHHHPTKM